MTSPSSATPSPSPLAVLRPQPPSMRRASNVAVIGSGISGALCASLLARGGVSVTVFESGRGPGGRMSQRRETTVDGEELFFDHGAPYFSVSQGEVMGVVGSWEARGLVAEWKERFGSFDKTTGMAGRHSEWLEKAEMRFKESSFPPGFSLLKDRNLGVHLLQLDQPCFQEEEMTKKYVGIPAMNSICKALCRESGVEARFGITVGRMDWLQDKSSWSLTGLNGQDLGHFDGVVASDKNISSARFAAVTGRLPPLDLSLHPELAVKWQDIPVRPCFVLMLAFSEPLSSIPLKGFSFKNSDVLSWAFCDSSKPGRSHVSTNGENWVLHSTPDYAARVIARTGLQKLSSDTLAMVAEELLNEFQATLLKIPHPFYMKAHRWGSAFPAITIGGEDKCLWDKDKNLVICGDFCANPSVEGAVLSGIRAASKILGI